MKIILPTQVFKLLERRMKNVVTFFDGKSYVKIIFPVFQCLIVSEKMSQNKTNFGQQKKYGLFFLFIFFWRKFSTKMF